MSPRNAFFGMLGILGLILAGGVGVYYYFNNDLETLNTEVGELLAEQEVVGSQILSYEVTQKKVEAKPSKRVEKEKQKSLFATSMPSGELPELNLLDEKLESEKRGYSEEALEGMSRLLEIKLKDFKIDAEVTEVHERPSSN